MTTQVLVLPSNPNAFDVKVEIFDNDVLSSTKVISDTAYFSTYVSTGRRIVITETAKPRVVTTNKVVTS